MNRFILYGLPGRKAFVARCAALAGLAILALVALLSIWANHPKPLSTTAVDPQRFVTSNAMRHLERLAQSPHPSGSEAQRRARDFLLAELRALGLEAHIQTSIGITPRFSSIGPVENIVARLRGNGFNRDAVLFAAHYDSVPAGPGAGDDGHAVAALIEMLRALKSAPPLRNDVILLFTDGEEDGLLGASAFVADHPWRSEPSIVINTEGRGNAGSPVMFQTGPGNGRLVRALADAAPDALATSISQEVYKRMPNDTDFTVFSGGGLSGLNFAHLGGWSVYHTSHDNPAALDLRTLQAHGDTLLALARKLGHANLSALAGRKEDAVYVSLPAVGLVHYPASWAIPLTALSCAAFGLRMAWRRQRRQTRLRAIGLVILLVPFTATAASLFAFGLQRVLSTAHGSVLPASNVASNGTYALALVMLPIAALSFGYHFLRRFLPVTELADGGLAVWLGLALTAAWTMPGVSLSLWLPATLALAGTVIAERGELWARAIGFGVAALALVVLAPLLFWLLTIFGVTPLGAQIAGAYVALCMWLALPQLNLIEQHWRGLTPTATLALAFAALVAGMVDELHGTGHHQAYNIFYALDADNGTAIWAARGEKIDASMRSPLGSNSERSALPQFFPAFFTNGDPQFSISSAPRLLLPPPRLELIGHEYSKAGRIWIVRATPARKGRWLTLWAPDAKIVSASIDGHAYIADPNARRSPERGWAVTYVNPPVSGVQFRLEASGQSSLTLRVIEMTMGLPTSIAGEPEENRIPIQSGDAAVVARTVTF